MRGVGTTEDTADLDQMLIWFKLHRVYLSCVFFGESNILLLGKSIWFLVWSPSFEILMTLYVCARYSERQLFTWWGMQRCNWNALLCWLQWFRHDTFPGFHSKSLSRAWFYDCNSWRLWKSILYAELQFIARNATNDQSTSTKRNIKHHWPWRGEAKRSWTASPSIWMADTLTVTFDPVRVFDLSCRQVKSQETTEARTPGSSPLPPRRCNLSESRWSQIYKYRCEKIDINLTKEDSLPALECPIVMTQPLVPERTPRITSTKLDMQMSCNKWK